MPNSPNRSFLNNRKEADDQQVVDVWLALELIGTLQDPEDPDAGFRLLRHLYAICHSEMLPEGISDADRDDLVIERLLEIKDGSLVMPEAVRDIVSAALRKAPDGIVIIEPFMEKGKVVTLTEPVDDGDKIAASRGSPFQVSAFDYVHKRVGDAQDADRRTIERNFDKEHGRPPKEPRSWSDRIVNETLEEKKARHERNKLERRQQAEDDKKLGEGGPGDSSSGQSR